MRDAALAFCPGQRIRMLPHTDLFMRGAVYGDVVSIGRKYVRVKLDRVSADIFVLPSSIEIVA